MLMLMLMMERAAPAVRLRGTCDDDSTAKRRRDTASARADAGSERDGLFGRRKLLCLVACELVLCGVLDERSLFSGGDGGGAVLAELQGG